MPSKACLLLSLLLFSQANFADDKVVRAWVLAGEHLRNNGNLLQAQQQFDQALHLVEQQDDTLHAEVAAASGYNLFLLNKKDAAEQQLKYAFEKTANDQTYLHALVGEYLGNLALSNADHEQAQNYFSLALNSLTNTDYTALKLSIALLQLGLDHSTNQQKSAKLVAYAKTVQTLADDNNKLKLQLAISQNLLDSGSEQLALIYQLLAEASSRAEQTGQNRVLAEAQLSLARLYHSQARDQEALLLLDRAVDLANQLNAKDLLAQLAAAKGDIQQAQGDKQRALTSYQQAVQYLDEIRAELPISLPDGRATLNVLIDPIHRRYVSLLLTQLEAKTPEQLHTAIYQAVDSMEIIKDADMKDFFLGRCANNADNYTDWKQRPLPEAAIIYPIILPDRLILVAKTDQSLLLRTVEVSADALKSQLQQFAKALQTGSAYRGAGQKLYDWLVQPLLADLQLNNVKTLVYVPDRDMRTVPYAAFYDGKHFLVEEFAVVTLPNLALPELQRLNYSAANAKALFAGLSMADGPSIGKLPKHVINEIASGGAEDNSINLSDAQRSVLTETLSLPSVEKEIAELATQDNSKVLMNGEFSMQDFKSHLESGEYSNVHIASHGFFGSNARDSFILSYDDAFYLEAFQASLSSTLLKQNPINLLTLSACETAQGNDRMLLGFSGMAVKSNVRSALGSLWPIDDEGAMVFMKIFYNGINDAKPKAEAVRQAQLDMIKSNKFKHPFYWSPFILTGSWE